MAKQSFYTTFEVSKICGVNPTSVQNWVKEKKLKAHVTPGGHRRIRREDLISFLREFGMPIPGELANSPQRVLVVDDEPDVVRILISVMRSADPGLEIASAGGGVEALLMIGERKPDLLILDIMMPDMDGFEVCQKLKSSATTSGIKIVAITGYDDPSTRERILEAGADLYFTKPLDVARFGEESLKLIRS